MKKGFLIGLLLFVFFIVIYAGATNFDRLVLGSGNYSTDPNTTADITFQNDEYIDNTTNGRLDMGAANLLTTGTIGGGVITGTGFTIGSAGITEAELELLDGITGSGSLTTAELLYVDGVTSAIQTQLNAKAALIDPTFTNKVTISDSLVVTGIATVGGITIGAAAIVEAELELLDGITGSGSLTTAELLFVDGVTSAIQTQLDAKAPIVDPTFTNIVTVTDSLRSSGVSVLTGATVFGGSLTGSALTRGTDTFTTTATADTVTVSGASTGDVYMVNYTAAAAATEAPLSVVSTATGFIVTRPAGTTSAITYAWMRQK